MNESQVSAAGADDNQIHMVVAAGDEYDANHQALEEKSNIGESGNCGNIIRVAPSR